MRESILLRWKKVEQADGYYIEQKCDGDWQFLMICTDCINIEIPDVNRDKDHEYRIRGFRYKDHHKHTVSDEVLTFKKCAEEKITGTKEIGTKDKKAVTEKKAAVQKKAAAEKKVTVQKKAAAEKKATAQKKTAANTAPQKRSFTVRYYRSENDEPLSHSTTVEYGVGRKIIPAAKLFSSEEKEQFIGWKVYREFDQCWLAADNDSGKKKWLPVKNGVLPEGYSFFIFNDGARVVKTAPSGIVRFTAVWKPAAEKKVTVQKKAAAEKKATAQKKTAANTAPQKRSFTVRYYRSENDEPLSHSTTVEYGVGRKIIPAAKLFSSEEKEQFIGWKVYREFDQCWLAADNDSGKKKWLPIENGVLPEGYSFFVFNDGARVVKTAPSGIVQFIAVWKQR